MKTNRAAHKRLRATGSGRIRRTKAGKSHLMRGKSCNRLRRLKKNDTVDGSFERRLKRLVPYIF